MILEFLTGDLLGWWLTAAGQPQIPPRPFPASILEQPDRDRDVVLERYLDTLAQQGFDRQNQAIWLQTDQQLLANRGGAQLQTPASLTKVATTLAALQQWGPNHRFQTEFLAAGFLNKGILQGDLIIAFSGDPLLVSSEWITIGNRLNQLGVQRVTGNLVLQGPLLVNLESDLGAVAPQLRSLWQSGRWPDRTQAIHGQLPAGTPKPVLTIDGDIVATSGIVNQLGTSLFTHSSLPLYQILRQMNIYSSNTIADWLADLLGGGAMLETQVLGTGRISPEELVLKNGSGLGQDNQLSPRAVVGLFQGIQAELADHQLTVLDLFPVAGRDRGTVEERKLPFGTTVKTGTLWNTSALAGMIPTQRYGPVWFAIMNRGDAYTEGFRRAQDQLLQSLVQAWGTGNRLPGTVGPPSPTERDRLQAVDQFMYDDFWGR